MLLEIISWRLMLQPRWEMADSARRLHHISDKPGIGVFEPRTGGHGFENEAVVWAIDGEHLPNYLLPRECPRVTFRAREDSDPGDVERLLCGAGANRVIAIESIWQAKIREERLYQYEFDAASFETVDEGAGYHISREPVKPVSEREIRDILGELLLHDVELRVMPSLWKLREAVVRSTLEFSIIRMRNAQPPAEGYEHYWPLSQHLAK